MIFALCVNNILYDISENIRSMISMIREASLNGAKCVVFSEAAFTGLVNNDDPSHDLALSFSLDDPEIKEIFEFSQNCGTDVVFGFFENNEGHICDSAVYYDNQTNSKYVYRRISEGWFGPKADRRIYTCGSDTEVFTTGIGKVSLLICGDLFDENLIKRIRENDSKLLIVPFARCFPESVADPKTEWDLNEKYAYSDQIRKTGKKSVLVNYISGYGTGDYFGGAMVVDSDGKIIEEKAAFEKGILYIDVNS
ncbi:MAG: carbon-nitrogen hydrolase family protein [Candidatus Delongbacteria bacterium]|nr:carbon-nitrogen hydrolase family protein [Candidatus Delongbacteria bacterium]